VAKLFSFRFDVDTHRCVRVGMPALSELGRQLEAPFTFFMNMGRAVSIPMVVRGWGGVASERRNAAKLSARSKLGWAGYARTALTNPRVGSAALDVIRESLGDGHEIGLHGGTNHQTWQGEADCWSADRLISEVDAVLPRLCQAFASAGLTTPGPAGFASPGWTTSSALPALLADRGFCYLADQHGPAPAEASGPAGAHGPAAGASGPAVETSGPAAGAFRSVRTQLTGEPGGVAYLEHLRASGLDDDAVVERFTEDLHRAGPHVIAYDHPYFAGVRELDMVRRMVDTARGAGYRIVSVAEIAEAGAS
jgi:peptidoglycan/xylan/chitin deacetylase (PgdA/CDA1 family)